MKCGETLARTTIGAWVGLGLCVAPAAAQLRWIDVERSKVTVQLAQPSAETTPEAGMVLDAPLAEGSVEDTDRPHLAIVINVDTLRVVGTTGSTDDRTRLRAQLLGPEGLDGARFSRVTYHSLTIDQMEGGVWVVHGELEMHGRFLPLQVRAERHGDRFTGTATVRPADFGIAPMPLPGASTLVGQEVLVQFEIVLEAP